MKNYELELRRNGGYEQPPARLRSGPGDHFAQATQLRAQLSRYLTALRKRWWVIFGSLLMIGGPAVLYSVTRPPSYRSQAMMWLTGKVALPHQEAYAEGVSSYIGTQAELMKNPSLQLRALEKVSLRFPWVARPKTNAASAQFPFELSVRGSIKSAVLELRATGPDREATQAFLDAVMEEYDAYKRDSRKKTSSGALSSLTEQIHEVERQIQKQQDQLTQFQVSNNVSYLTEHGVSAGSHLSKLTEVLSDLKTEQQLLELLTPGQFKGLAEGPQGVLSDMAVPGEKAARALSPATSATETAYYQALQQIQILKARRDEFGRVLRPTHSKMVKLNQEIAGLDQLLKTLQDDGEQRALARMEDRRKALQLQIANLESQYHAWETNGADASRKLAEYDRMRQEMQRSQALYDRLLGLMQTVDVNNNIDQESLVPMAPASAARPTLDRYRVGAAGLFLAGLVGVGAFVLLAFLDDRFASARELSLQLPAEVVGQIPNTRFKRRKGTQRLLPANSAFTEAFRDLRTSLVFMSGNNPSPKVVLVTSAIPGEGKTTVSANLASTLALSGSRVLLVDADFYRGSIHHLFDVRAKPGLVQVLERGIAPTRAIVATAEPNLFILPSGAGGETSSDVFLRCRVDLLLRELANQFDHVVLDSAPVLATGDAGCLAPITDGVFMVVRAAHTSSRVASDALERLMKRNSRILGLIYNRASERMDYYSRYTREYHRSNGSVRNTAPASEANAASHC